MNIYKISFDYNYAFADIVESRNGADSLELSIDNLETLMDFRYDWLTDESNVTPDFVIIISELLGCAKKNSHFITKLCPNIVLHPILIGSKEFNIQSNIPVYQDRLNLKKSKITRFSNGDIMEISNPVLLSSEYSPLFRLEEIPSTYFCTELFKNMVESNNLTGLKFEECKVKSKSWF